MAFFGGEYFIFVFVLVIVSLFCLNPDLGSVISSFEVRVLALLSSTPQALTAFQGPWGRPCSWDEADGEQSRKPHSVTSALQAHS